MNWGFGAWDSDKCTTVMSEQHSTVCECYTDGTFGKYLPSSYVPISTNLLIRHLIDFYHLQL